MDPAAGAKPESIVPTADGPVTISGTANAVSIHGPQVVGATPTRPFLFSIPATGKPPLTFSADALPAGLTLDPATGIISGGLKAVGESHVNLTVTSPDGTAKRTLTIIAGAHKLAQTPPMGWNSRYVCGRNVDAAKVRQAADWLVSSGLAAHGYQYVNIDDGWAASRGPDGQIQPGPAFPDMKALADYVHSKGLKLGIYSSPGPKTCLGLPGSYQHEVQDAKTFAGWGIDYLKYEWCSYNDIAKDASRAEVEKPYKTMRGALDSCGRDMVYSVSQDGMGHIWEWGQEIGSNLWQAAGDIGDSWGKVTSAGFGQYTRNPFTGPGHWNDIDMLVVGKTSKLTHVEQMTQVTLWSLLAAPMLVSIDLSQLDPFTIDMLTNDEVIDIDQDPLGTPASMKLKDGPQEVWTRPLSDGTMAVGVFNRLPMRSEMRIKWSALKLKGPQSVRDLWLRKDLGTFKDSFGVEVPAHGCALVKGERQESVKQVQGDRWRHAWG